MDFSKYFKKKNDSKVKNFFKSLEIFEKVNDERIDRRFLEEIFLVSSTKKGYSGADTKRTWETALFE